MIIIQSEIQNMIFSDIIQQTVAKGTFNLLSFMYQQMLMIGIGSGQYLVTVLASIGGNVLKMFVFNMVLESSQTAAGLDQTTLCALIWSPTKLSDPFPDHVTDGFGIICMKIGISNSFCFFFSSLYVSWSHERLSFLEIWIVFDNIHKCTEPLVYEDLRVGQC